MSRKSIINKSSHFLSSTLFVIGGSCLFVFLSWSVLNEYLRERSINAEVEDLKSAIIELEQKNGELKTSLSYIQTPEYQELEAKRQLGLVKEGESVVIFSDFPSTPIKETGDNNPEEKILTSNSQKWWKYFFN